MSQAKSKSGGDVTTSQKKKQEFPKVFLCNKPKHTRMMSNK